MKKLLPDPKLWSPETTMFTNGPQTPLTLSRLRIKQKNQNKQQI